MAELLCMAVNNGYDLGDIVQVKEDGFPWRPGESKAAWLAAEFPEEDWQGKFFIIKIPGVAAAKIEEMLEADMEESLEADPLAPGGFRTVTNWVRRRKNYLKHQDLPSNIKVLIGEDYEITVTPTQIRQYMKRKNDDTTVTLDM